MSESEETKTTFRLPKTLLKDVKRYAIDHDTNATEIFKDALRSFLNEHRNAKTPGKSTKKKKVTLDTGEARSKAFAKHMAEESEPQPQKS